MKVIRGKESYEGWLCGIRDEWEGEGIKEEEGKKRLGRGKKRKMYKAVYQCL